MLDNPKHALITGGSRGIGRGIALKLAEHGTRIAVHYFCNESAANYTLAEVRKRGSDGFVVQADISQARGNYGHDRASEESIQ
jgi:NAD(P)-dependent dehydrogenase (short-subunit alcohol dehydrogenase family)